MTSGGSFHSCVATFFRGYIISCSLSLPKSCDISPHWDNLWTGSTMHCPPLLHVKHSWISYWVSSQWFVALKIPSNRVNVQLCFGVLSAKSRSLYLNPSDRSVNPIWFSGGDHLLSLYHWTSGSSVVQTAHILLYGFSSWLVLASHHRIMRLASAAILAGSFPDDPRNPHSTETSQRVPQHCISNALSLPSGFSARSSLVMVDYTT